MFLLYMVSVHGLNLESLSKLLHWLFTADSFARYKAAISRVTLMPLSLDITPVAPLPPAAYAEHVP